MGADTSRNTPPDIFGTWDNQSLELKAQFSQLTDSDLNLIAGKENELIKRVAARLNKKYDEVIHIIRKTQTEKF